MGLPPPPSLDHLIPGGLGGPPPPPPPPPSGPPSRAIKLDGMLTMEMLASDEEYAEVLDDIKTECEELGGTVEGVVMPRSGPQATSCFVLFAEVGGATKAREALDKRQFDGNTVSAKFVQEGDVPAAE